MRNPELIRNLWLEFTPHRLIITPIILVALFFISHKTMGTSGVSTTAYVLYLGFAFIWGTRCASDAVCSEINHNTWDWQRTSQIKPLTMTLGKLLGSTSFAWFAAMLCLFMFFIFSHAAGDKNIAQRSLVLIMGGLFSHALALLFSVMAIDNRKNANIGSFKYFFIALVIGSIATNIAYMSNHIDQTFATIHWHQIKFSASAFTFLSLLIFLLWSVIGVYRSMRQELQYRNIPWVWTAFVLFMMIYCSGLANIELPTQLMEKNIKEMINYGPLYTAFGIGLALTYLSFLSENINKLSYHKCLSALQYKGILAALERSPRWPYAFTLVLICGIWLATSPQIASFKPAAYAFTMLLFLIRDVLIAHYFSFSPSPKRTLATIFLYFILLYFIIPMVLSLLGLTQLAACFLPSYGDKVMFSVFGSIVQIASVGYLTWGRWQD